jgi:MFS family permease
MSELSSYFLRVDGVGLFGGEIVASISPKNSESVSSPNSLRSTSLKQVFALSLGIPGCALSLFLLKPLGVRRLQTLGFLAIAFSFCLLTSVYDQLIEDHPTVLYGIYCLLLLSLSFGPMLTVFILPTEAFPKEIRATFGGIAAACGKLGAFVGAYIFGPLASATSFPFVMAVCSVLAVFGALLSHYCIGAENRDSVCSTTSLPASQVPFTNPSECTMSLMHSERPHSNCPPAPASPRTSNESLTHHDEGVHAKSDVRAITEAEAQAAEATSPEDSV